MYLGQCLGAEQVDFEYKEFCLKHLPYDYWTEEEIRNIFDGEWDVKLNDIIRQNIDIYIELYASKYVASFANSKLNGNLLIGCNDYGEITGIPYLMTNDGDFDILKSNIKTKIQIELKNKLSEQVSVKVEVKRLKVNRKFLEDEMKPLLSVYDKRLIEHKALTRKFTRQKQQWMNQVLKYSAKLYVLLNTDVRKELIQFIITRDGNPDVVKKLKTAKYIPPPSGDEMKEVRDGMNYDSLEYWLAKFKDDTLEKIMMAKPKRTKKQIPQSPSMLIHRLSLLRYAMSKNPNVVFFTIKIMTPSLDSTKIVKYNDKNLGWISNLRMCDERGPCHKRI
jgi:hypothetical protein